ncbi:hypothetical protein KAX97_10415 [candidate division WOR-3 bacterium]|nr:hypothetical protein [candidate division WOR-3 bacterium]
MKCIFRLSIAAVLVVAALGCGPRIMVPPKIDLTQHEVIGIIEFKSSNEGELGPLATKKFMDAIRRDQEMVRIVELGSEDEVLNAVNSDKLDQTTYKALGEKHKVITIFTGELIVSDVRPDITIAPLFGHMDFTAEVDATLNAQMVEITTGASIWSGSASATKKIGEVSIFGGKNFVFDAENPDRAYGKLVDELVEKVTKDFRVTWKRE